MIAVRVISSRANYARGGLVFAEPRARRVTGGLLAIDLTMEKFMALGLINIRELRTDAAITVVQLDNPATAHAIYRARQAAHQARHPHTPIRKFSGSKFSGMEQRSARLAHNQEVGGSNPSSASTFQPAAPVLPAKAATAGDAIGKGASSQGDTTPGKAASGKGGAVGKTAPPKSAAPKTKPHPKAKP